MSDAFFSSLYAVRDLYMTNCFDEQISLLLTGKEIPRAHWLEDRRRSAARYLSIASRGKWFQSRMGDLIRLSGITELQFLSGEAYTHQHEEVTESEGKVVWRETVAYTVLNPNYDQVISSVGRLEQWCLSNPELAAPILDIYPKDLPPAYESACFTLDPTNEGLGEGDDAVFAFCVLRTIGDVMRYARLTKCWAVHRTTLRCGS